MQFIDIGLQPIPPPSKRRLRANRAKFVAHFTNHDGKMVSSGHRTIAEAMKHMSRNARLRCVMDRDEASGVVMRRRWERADGMALREVGRG
jgi:hypothetical protein